MDEKTSLASDRADHAVIPAHLRKPRLRRWEASEYLERVHGLRVAATTLAKYATVGGGPVMDKFGRVPLYRPVELDAWASAKLGTPIRSTSDCAA